MLFLFFFAQHCLSSQPLPLCESHVKVSNHTTPSHDSNLCYFYLFSNHNAEPWNWSFIIAKEKGKKMYSFVSILIRPENISFSHAVILAVSQTPIKLVPTPLRRAIEEHCADSCPRFSHVFADLCFNQQRCIRDRAFLIPPPWSWCINLWNVQPFINQSYKPVLASYQQPH